MPRRVISNMHQAIIGQDRALDLVMSALLAGGHILLDDVPGVGKTLMAKSLAQSIDGIFKRIQFSPDLMPSDVTGLNIYTPPSESQSGRFRFIQGPVFANVLLADEINRASPRTQASLLEAMEEGVVTVDGETHPLPKPFLVIATQNPVEFHGTFPLPEAQLDRFAVRLSLGYPAADEEAELLRRSAAGAAGATPGHEGERVHPVVTPQQLSAWQRDVRTVRVDPSLQAYIVQFANLTRNHPQISLGLSPRGSLTWQRIAQAYAYLQGRGFVTPDDLKTTAEAVLAHRLIVSGRSSGTQSKHALLDELLGSQPIPV
jgi:MoxR-like ATPase